MNPGPSLLQSFADWLWPVHPQARAPGVHPDVYLRPLIVLGILLFCGPEVFAAADLVALLDLLGGMLFLTAFAAGYRILGLTALSGMQRVFLPAEWTVFLKTPRHPPIVAHGLLLVGVNAMQVLVFCLIAVSGVFAFVKQML